MTSVKKMNGVPSSLISNLKEALTSRQDSGNQDTKNFTDDPDNGQSAFTAAYGGPHVANTSKDCNLVEGGGPCVLVTNADGVQAPGLRALVESLVSSGSCRVFVCAPDRKATAVGHSITVYGHVAASCVEMKGAAAYEVSGTPADCVSLGLSGLLFPWKSPTLVLSGIDGGCSCGYDIFYSGTVAGAREAFLRGVPAIAFSLNWQSEKSSENDFDGAAAVCLPLISAALCDIQVGKFPEGCYLKVDVPASPLTFKGYKVTKQGISHMAGKWQSVSARNALTQAGISRENAIGVRLAQLGLAASAVGASRQFNSATKNIEIESVACHGNGSQQEDLPKKLYFKKQCAEVTIGETKADEDLRCLQEGYVAITPLSLQTRVEDNAVKATTDWILTHIN